MALTRYTAADVGPKVERDDCYRGNRVGKYELIKKSKRRGRNGPGQPYGGTGRVAGNNSTAREVIPGGACWS